jgi:hypothetical protein
VLTRCTQRLMNLGLSLRCPRSKSNLEGFINASQIHCDCIAFMS